MFVKLLRRKQEKAPKKISKSYLQRRRNGETETTRVLPKLQEIFKTVVSRCVAAYERLTVCDCSAFSKWASWKKFRRKSIQVRYRRKEEPDKKYHLGLKKGLNEHKSPTEHTFKQYVYVIRWHIRLRLMCPFFVFHHILSDLLLNKRTATWNLFFKYLRCNEAN